MSGLLVGGHVEQEDPIAEATARGAGLSQFFLGDPQGWKGPKVAYAGGAEALKDAAGEAGIKLYVHAPYVINVATSNNRIRIPSRKLLQQTLTGAAEIGAAGVIVHGGHVLAKDDPELGFENWFKCIDRTEIEVPLLIENTAGGDRAMARHLSSIEKLWQAISTASGAEQVGFCLDTCHFHAGGEELVGLVDRVKAITGRVDLVHANDSRDAFGSGADRHTNLGAGEADPDGLAAVVADAGVPVVVETPGGVEGQSADIDWLRQRVG
ncbi:deoxyribonuclease IV [Microlunatus soli]|uniref:Deoxyribonuclease-4 n=1 Tax=Microlunatus soli TaxID=630515 RepID=A0A1H1U6K1_9ACTN|nr:deoxyribonuclease IV [Microlunatus soli]SDS67981.1 deoxyribonuclease-4 [Microlunatus soli]